MNRCKWMALMGVLIAVAANAAQPVVSNVRASQRSGTKLVDMGGSTASHGYVGMLSGETVPNMTHGLVGLRPLPRSQAEAVAVAGAGGKGLPVFGNSTEGSLIGQTVLL